MKAYIGAGVAGALALAGVLAFTLRTSAPVQAAPDRATYGSSLIGAAPDNTAGQPILVNCGEGRQAMVRQTLVGERTVSRVECVPDAAFGLPADGMTGAQFGVPGQAFQQPAPAVAPPAAPAARERVVYRDRPVVRERVVYRDPPAARPASTTTSSGTRSADHGDYDRGDYGRGEVEAQRPGRSWKKSAIIIGGSAAGGAGVGAVLGGKDGAKKGAVLGGVAGTVYDIATRNKDRH